jgi:hypothetical protein
LNVGIRFVAFIQLAMLFEYRAEQIKINSLVKQVKPPRAGGIHNHAEAKSIFVERIASAEGGCYEMRRKPL